MAFKREKTNLLISTWFNTKEEFILFIFLSLLGIGGAFFGSQLINGFQFDFGKNLVGLFVPPLLCILYLTYVGYHYRFTNKTLIKVCVLFCIQVIPYTPFLFQTFEPTIGDDFSRYYLSAKNMVDNHTLWGGDKLYYNEAGYHYVTQPGYRYFVALELLLFQDMFRIVQFINILLFLLTIYFFFKVLVVKIPEKRLRLHLLLLTLLFSPYVVKNILMGLSEWFTVVLLLWVCYCYLVQNIKATVFLLGLAPFFRQNLLITVLLIFIWMMINNKRKTTIFALFLVPLFLPIYHNLYYANEWRFFVDLYYEGKWRQSVDFFQLPIFNYDEKNQEIKGFNYSLIVSNIIHYIGLDRDGGKLTFSMIAAIFLPYATVLYCWFIKLIPTIGYRTLFLLLSMSAIAPNILLGYGGYYPRFELVNVVVSVITFLILYTYLHNQQKKESLQY